MDSFVIKDSNSFKALGEGWNDLLANTNCNNIFNSWEWNYTWWQTYRNTSMDLCIVIVKDEEKLVAVAPLYAINQKKYGLLRQKKIMLIGGGAVASDHRVFIVRKDFEKTAIEIILKTVHENIRPDNIELCDFPESSTVLDSIIHLEEKEHHNRCTIGAKRGCPYLPVPIGWDDFLEQKSWRTRKHIRHDCRKLLEKLKAQFCLIERKDELDKAFDKLIQLHQDRWVREGKIGSFGTERFVQFHREIIDRYHNDFVRMYVLKLNDEIIAGYYAFFWNNCLFLYSTGFEPAYQKYGPGTVLLASVVQRAIEENIKEIDLLRGESAYKYKWTELKRQNNDLLVWCNKVHYRLHIIEKKVNAISVELAKKILPNWLYLKLQKMRDRKKLQ